MMLILSCHACIFSLNDEWTCSLLDPQGMLLGASYGPLGGARAALGSSSVRLGFFKHILGKLQLGSVVAIISLNTLITS